MKRYEIVRKGDDGTVRCVGLRDYPTRQQAERLARHFTRQVSRCGMW